MQTFAVCLSGTGQSVGATSLCHIDAANRRAEIGYTWYAASQQGTGINAACKLLVTDTRLPRHGLYCGPVPHSLAQPPLTESNRTLGAKQDGILRSHMIASDGTLRDTVVYSIIASEWPAVRAELSRRLTAPK
jgi:N-acetyltransferase